MTGRTRFGRFAFGKWTGPRAGAALLALAAGALVPTAPLAHADEPAKSADAKPPQRELTGDAIRANRAHAAIMELSTDEAKKELDGGSPTDALLELERGLLAIYEGRCSEALELLAQPSLADVEPAQRLAAIARGCAFTMAGAVVREDAASGSWIRFQHDADVVLAPFLFEVVSASRAVFARDLGVTMPATIRIEVVRDQHGLAAMTGLPLAAARTTGTIGIAKWGRVTIVSPRASENGYPVMDTLAHELTHMALTRGSRDLAPLWLQEGVARSEEAKWRVASPFDAVPSADDLAAFGIKKNIGPDIDKIGPSIALLPSAEQAQVTYAKVQSFMDYYAREAGAGAMPRLLEALKDAPDPSDLDSIILKLTGSTFAAWSARWKAQILGSARELSDADRPGAAPPKELKEVRQRFRLGELLLDRGHAKPASKELERAHALLPSEAGIRALYARALVDAGDPAHAKPLVERAEDVHHNDARWWSMRAALEVPNVEDAIKLSIALAPYDPGAVCEEKKAPLVPEDAARRALCEAAREKPRGR